MHFAVNLERAGIDLGGRGSYNQKSCCARQNRSAQ